VRTILVLGLERISLSIEISNCLSINFLYKFASLSRLVVILELKSDLISIYEPPGWGDNNGTLLLLPPSVIIMLPLLFAFE
jgi:hypothetical protein